ncbi:MAG: hypothetical protein H6623_03575 [Bdellovibrionaceae bacterium]|nr:hypothetical protein [Pseudobdellovibrionaceae bacterium]
MFIFNLNFLFHFAVCLFSFLAFVRCAHTDKDESTAPTYQQCVDKQEDLRKSHYLKMPEFFRQSVAGSHPIVKYYPYSPSAKELSSDVKKLDGENSFIDARKEEGTQNKDPLLSDNSPARNRIFFQFERQAHYRFGDKEDVVLLRADYGAPEIIYRCPLKNFKQETGVWRCQLKGQLSSIKTIDGRSLLFNYDFTMRLIPIGDKHLYFEWLSVGDKMESDLASDHYALRVLLYTQSEDRFRKWDFPYFDEGGELNPDACADLEGR